MLIRACYAIIRFIKRTELAIQNSISRFYHHVVTRQAFKRIGVFNEGFASVELKNGRWSYINLLGKPFDGDFAFCESFNNGAGRVKIDENRWNFVNKKGKIISDVEFIDASDFSCGWGLVTLADRRYNYINSKGKMLSETGFPHAASFFSNGLAMVVLDDERLVVINNRGDIINTMRDASGNFFLPPW